MRFLPLFLLASLTRTAFSAPLPAFEGTVSQTQNGQTRRAKIAWSPPDTLRIETLPDPLLALTGSTLLARGEQTTSFDAATLGTRRAPYNIATNWWRGARLGFGGPANFLFAGTGFPAADQAGRYLVRDSVIFGGGGRDVYYAAKKRVARRYAAQIALAPTSRIERDEAGKITLDAKIVLDGTGLPRTASAIFEGERAEFTYDLKLAPSLPEIPALEAPIIEAIDLASPSSYAGKDASSLFNRGAAYNQNEEAPRALAALEAANLAAPDASAPLLALFEISLALRDAPRAQLALEKLEKLPLDKPEIEVRRARLALLNRDRAGALAAFQAASDSAPGNLTLRLAQAEIKRSLSDFEGARALYREVLASEAPQFEAKRAAAENLALSATFEELPALLESVPAQNDAQLLARALVQLRAAQTPETLQFARDEFQTALALGFERAARDDEAQKAWKTLENRAPDALKNRARAHQMTLAARRGDVSGAIVFYREWKANLASQRERDAAQNAFFAAFQKAFRSDALQTALANRATATNASEDDLRLFLGYQEGFGTPAEVLLAIETGAVRFGNSAFWMGKRAENLVEDANSQRSNEAGTARREQLYTQALALLDRAIERAPDEPFYRAQRALAATQRATKTGAILDPGIAVRNRALAKRETEGFLAAFPGDPDVLVSAALQNLALQSDAGAREAIRLATLALDTPPGEGDGDRHALVWAAHQALASAYKRLGQLDLAGAQWETLLLGARDAGEQAALASSYFALLDGAGDEGANPRNANATPQTAAVPSPAVQGAARLLAQLAGEKWDYTASRSLLESVATRVSLSPRAGAISRALSALKSPGAILARATLASRRLETARRTLQNPEAPPAADAELERATRDLNAALRDLRVVAQSPDRALAARAAAFVAENGGLAGEERLELLQSALEKEPRDAALRFALIDALEGAESLKERAIAARLLDFTPETRRSLAASTRRAGDGAGALRIAEEAFALAARTPETNGGDLQRVAFTLGKSAFAANQNSRALEIYGGLALPQWTDLDRAAALLAQARNLREAAREADAAQLDAQVAKLGLSEAQLSVALAFADGLE